MPIGNQYGMPTAAKKTACETALILASTTREITKPPVFFTAISQTVKKIFCFSAGSHDAIDLRTRCASAEK